MRKLVALALVAACGSPAKKPAPTPPAPPTPVDTKPAPEAPKETKAPEPPKDPRVAADLASFDKVWETIGNTYFDPKMNGLDWKAVRAELRPKVEASKDRDEARAVMMELVHRLGKSHFGIFPANDDEPSGGGSAEIGVDVRIVDGAPIVLRVEAGSPAAAQKALGPGRVLVKVDGVELAPKLAAVAAKLPNSTLVPLLQARVVEHLLSGKDGSSVKVETTDGTPRGKAEVTVTRKPPAARMVSMGNLGPEPLVYESKWLDKQIGYIRLSIFLDPPTVMPAIGKDLEGFAKATGVIIDLRGNPGGIGAMAMGIAGRLIGESDKKLGTMRTRQSTLDFVINPQATIYAGKVAVLIDESSASTSEIFAGGMQDLKRARIFGRRSPGAALPSVIDTLPNGDKFQYAIADYVSVSGAVLEGRGVTPDVPVVLDPKVLRSGQDPDMVAATRWINEKAKP